MSFLDLEQALNTITTGSIISGPFKGSEQIFRDLFMKYRYNPQKLAKELSKTIVLLAKHAQKKKYLTVEEYAKIIGRHPWTVRKQCREGKIPTAKKIGTTWIIS